METMQMTPSFSSTFFAASVFIIHFGASIIKIHSHVDPPGSILVGKIPQFMDKSYWFGQPIRRF